MVGRRGNEASPTHTRLTLCDFENGGQLLVLLDFVVTTLPSLIEIHTALGILGNTNNKSVGVE